jgi:hypothetical protein
VTFKDLKKRVSLVEATHQSKMFDRLCNKPFWIWDKQQHKLEDIRTYGHCCFNHIIGLPKKDGLGKPFYDYQRIIFESLATPGDNTNSYGKHLWMKKATGLRF